MSDDLVKRLRDLGDHAAFEPHMHHTAADRIEELEAKLFTCATDLDIYMNAHASLEVKLAKAVETLKRYGGVMPVAFTPIQDGGYKARTTLAELTGGKDE